MGEDSVFSNSRIHALIQDRDRDYYSLIRDHTEEIENHIEVCEACHDRMIIWASKLPRLLSRVTVQLPAPSSYHEWREQLDTLARGQCLPCGCQVWDVAWTREEASLAFIKGLAEVLGVSEEQANKIPTETKMTDLPLDIKSLRRLRDKFWIPDGSYGSSELRDAEEGEKVKQLPETVGSFVAEILRIHCGISWRSCCEHGVW